MFLIQKFFSCFSLPKTKLESDIENLLNNDSEISALFKKLVVPIKIKSCGEGIRALYYIPDQEIWIDPTITDENALKESLLHEYIHAYDDQVNQLSITTLKGLAKAEIHAMKLCECKNSMYPRLETKLMAIQAVTLSINNAKLAEEVVGSVFDETYDDDFASILFD